MSLLQDATLDELKAEYAKLWDITAEWTHSNAELNAMLDAIETADLEWLNAFEDSLEDAMIDLDALG